MRYSLLAILLCGFASIASAQERLGTLEVADLFIEPRFQYREWRDGGFEAGNSLVSFRWIRDDVVSATITAGTQDLVGRPKRYVGASEDELTLAEAFIEARSTLGTFRFGRVALPFGTESGRPESQLRFPRSIFFRERWLGLRDQGISYSVEHRGFFNDWAVNNGEGGTNLDNQNWFTARWGWSDRKNFGGFSGSTGRTNPSATQDSLGSRTIADAQLDPNAPARLRFGNIFYQFEGRNFGWGLEGIVGETRQNDQITIMRAGHLDFQYWISKNVSALARWDWLEPSNRFNDDQVQEQTFGISWRGWYETSTLYLLASRVQTQGNDDSNHQALVIWRLSPLARGEK